MGIRININFPQLKAALKERYHRATHGTEAFPSRRVNSRFATMAFAAIAVDRRNLASNYRMTISRLLALGPNAQTKFREIFIREKLLLWGDRRKADTLPFYFRHYNFRKRISPKRITALIETLNQEFEQDIFRTDGKGRFWVELEPIEQPAKLEAPSLESSIKEILRTRARPLKTEDLMIALKEEGASFSEEELTLSLSTLLEDGTLKLADAFKEHAYYLNDVEIELNYAGSLIPVMGFNHLLTRGGLLGFRRTGQIVELLSDGRVDFVSASYLKQSKDIPYTEYYTEKGVKFIRDEELELVQAEEKLLFGSTADKEKIAIQNSPVCRKRYAKQILTYEIRRLQKTLMTRGLAVMENLDRIRAAAKHSKDPAYLAIYRARKVLEIGGTPSLALAAVLCNQKLPELETATLNLIKQYQEINSWPFDLETEDETYIDYAARMQKQTEDSVDVIRLLLAANIARVVYQPETLDEKDWPKCRFLYAYLAEQNGFDYLADLFKDLYLMNVRPHDYGLAATFFQQKTGMTRIEALKFLEPEAQKIKRLICEEWLGLDESEVDVYFRPKSFHSTVLKDRDILDLFGIRIVIHCKALDATQQEKDSFAAIETLHPFLKEYLTAKKIKNHIYEPRASGWQAIKYDGQIKGHDVEVILQTEKMFRFEKQSDMKQNHAARDINKEPGIRQDFEVYPEHVLPHLSLDAERNFSLAKEADQNNVFPFIAIDADGEALFETTGFNAKKPDRYTYQPQKFSAASLKGERVFPTPEDMFARYAKTNNLPLRSLARVEIYRFGTDTKGRRVLIPQKRSGRIYSGDVVVFKTDPNVAQLTKVTHLKSIMENSVYYATRLRAWKEHRQLAAQLTRDRQAQETLGSESQRLQIEGLEKYAKVFDRLQQRKKIGRRKTQVVGVDETVKAAHQSFGFKNPDNFFLALGLDLIDEQSLIERLSDVIDDTGYSFEIQSLDAQRQKIVFSIPYSKEIFRQLYHFGLIKEGNLLSIRSSSHMKFEEVRIRVEFTIESSEEKVEPGHLEAYLENIVRSKQKHDTTQDFSPRLKLFALRLEPKPNQTSSWFVLYQLINAIQDDQDMRVFAVDLPENPTTDNFGIISVEIPDIENKIDKLRDYAKILNTEIEEL